MRSVRCTPLAWLAALACGGDGCEGGGGHGDDDDESTGSADTNDSEESAESADATTDTGEIPQEGLLACPGGASCTIVIASQALDDRVEFFTARGDGPAYRGAIDVDLKPNPMGNNEGENLDEPFGMTVSEAGLSLLLGHYPMRDRGSLVVFPHEFLAMQTPGATVPQSSFFADDTFTPPVLHVLLDEEEPIFALQHPSGRILVGAFENDLFTPEPEWTSLGKLLVIDPVTGDVGRRVLDLGEGCEGAWSLVALDEAKDRVALSCDGNDSVVVLDVSGIADGTPETAAAAIDGCAAVVPALDKRVRALAPDGEGGFLLVETGLNAGLDAGHLHRFAGDCTSMGAPGDLDPLVFDVRTAIRFEALAGTRWFLSSGFTPMSGVHVVRDGDAGAEVCGRLADLDAWWTADDGSTIDPYALALDRGHDGLAIGAGPSATTDDMPGYGRVLWAELDASVDPCEASPVAAGTQRTPSAPAVSADDPTTWRRGPNVVHIVEYGP